MDGRMGMLYQYSFLCICAMLTLDKILEFFMPSALDIPLAVPKSGAMHTYFTLNIWSPKQHFFKLALTRKGLSS